MSRAFYLPPAERGEKPGLFLMLVSAHDRILLIPEAELASPYGGAVVLPPALSPQPVI